MNNILWVLFNSNGQVIYQCNEGAVPFAGTTDYKIYAVFKNLNINNFGSDGSIKFYKPDLDSSCYPLLVTKKKEDGTALVFGGTTNDAFTNGVAYDGWLFDFADYDGEDQTVALLDTSGLWRAVITLYSATDSSRREVVGSVAFNVGNGNESEDGTEINLDSLLNGIYSRMSKKLDIDSPNYIKTINNISNYDPTSDVYHIRDVILDRSTNYVYQVTAPNKALEKIDFGGAGGITMQEVEKDKNLFAVVEDIFAEDINAYENGKIVYDQKTKAFYQLDGAWEDYKIGVYYLDYNDFSISETTGAGGIELPADEMEKILNSDFIVINNFTSPSTLVLHKYSGSTYHSDLINYKENMLGFYVFRVLGGGIIRPSGPVVMCLWQRTNITDAYKCIYIGSTSATSGILNEDQGRKYSLAECASVNGKIYQRNKDEFLYTLIIPSQDNQYTTITYQRLIFADTSNGLEWHLDTEKTFSVYHKNVVDTLYSQCVDLRSEQTVSGQKTFNVPIKIAYTISDDDDAVSKLYVDTVVSGAVHFIDTVADLTELNAIQNPAQGDMYWVTSESSYYIWNGSSWSKTGGTVDLSNYYNRTESDARYVTKTGGVVNAPESITGYKRFEATIPGSGDVGFYVGTSSGQGTISYNPDGLSFNMSASLGLNGGLSASSVNAATIRNGDSESGYNDITFELYASGASSEKGLVPNATGQSNLGSSTYKWKNLFLSGNLSDGTNEVAIADIVTKEGGTQVSPTIIGGYKDFTNRVKFNGDIIVNGSITASNNVYGLTIPSASTWSANQTIATQEWVNSKKFQLQINRSTQTMSGTLNATQLTNFQNAIDNELELEVFVLNSGISEQIPNNMYFRMTGNYGNLYLGPVCFECIYRLSGNEYRATLNIVYGTGDWDLQIHNITNAGKPLVGSNNPSGVYYQSNYAPSGTPASDILPSNFSYSTFEPDVAHTQTFDGVPLGIQSDLWGTYYIKNKSIQLVWEDFGSPERVLMVYMSDVAGDSSGFVLYKSPSGKKYLVYQTL